MRGGGVRRGTRQQHVHSEGAQWKVRSGRCAAEGAQQKERSRRSAAGRAQQNGRSRDEPSLRVKGWSLRVEHGGRVARWGEASGMGRGGGRQAVLNGSHARKPAKTTGARALSAARTHRHVCAAERLACWFMTMMGAPPMRLAMASQLLVDLRDKSTHTQPPLSTTHSWGRSCATQAEEASLMAHRANSGVDRERPTI